MATRVNLSRAITGSKPKRFVKSQAESREHGTSPPVLSQTPPSFFSLLCQTQIILFFVIDRSWWIMDIENLNSNIFRSKMVEFFIKEAFQKYIFLEITRTLESGRNRRENRRDRIAARYYRDLFFSVAIIIGNESVELEDTNERYLRRNARSKWKASGFRGIYIFNNNFTM